MARFRTNRETGAHIRAIKLLKLYFLPFLELKQIMSTSAIVEKTYGMFTVKILQCAKPV